MAVQTKTQALARRLTPTEAAELAERARYRAIGAIMIVLGLGGYLLFANSVDPELVSTFGMSRGGSTVRVEDWVVPTYSTVALLSALSVFAGAYQFVRGFARLANAIFGLIILLFVFSFLTWATRDQSINLVGMLDAAVERAVPLALGALSGVLSERAGVVNIAIEGMMLSGAMFGSLIGSVSQSAWGGLAASVLVGLLLSLFHGVLSIRYKVDQIISGVVINIFSIGITSFISAKFLQQFQALNSPPRFPTTPIPVLSDIPIVGEILFNGNMFLYAMYVFLILVHVGLFYTRWGLRTRAVGEHPKAADTLGVNVFRTRYTAVLLSGMMAGFAGAYFTLGSVGRFEELMTAGRGFISLAAMIFGKWMPFGAFGAALIFGFAESLQGKLAILKVPIPSQFLLMAPYVATMIALAGLIGRTTAPAADGQPYEKE
ncbi:MAG TPA: ABC transporter permease [Anaerolineae bacterium]|nr:ABC transporter permease [Anaerolineae bacterium]